MARILEAHSSFNRGRAADDSWAWIMSLYSDQENFAKKYPEATAANVIAYYVTELDNPSSIQGSIRAARENARALRPLISTDMWLQINDFYTRFLAFTKVDFSETRLSRSCDTIKRGCYAEIGVAESTLYRDESWPFFRLGQFIERADQTSRLLDVQFAQRATGMDECHREQQAGLWNALLRSASAYHSFRRAQPRGLDPADVARFLIFDTRLPRSIAFCAGEIQRNGQPAARRVPAAQCPARLRARRAFLTQLQTYSRDDQLITRLHNFNDWVQRELMELTSELGTAFFGHQTSRSHCRRNRLLRHRASFRPRPRLRASSRRRAKAAGRIFSPSLRILPGRPDAIRDGFSPPTERGSRRGTHDASRRADAQDRISLRPPDRHGAADDPAAPCPALPHADPHLFADADAERAFPQLAAGPVRQLSGAAGHPGEDPRILCHGRPRRRYGGHQSVRLLHRRLCPRLAVHL